MIDQIRALLKECDGLLVAHYYQRDEVVEIADLTGDSLELARKASQSERSLVVFCGVGFMGQSVKILAPHKRVIMPRLACCSMARMIDDTYFDESIALMQSYGIHDIFPITYINSNAQVKAKVGAMGGVVCTSANAGKIFEYAQSHRKKIFFLPDRCLGLNLAKRYGIKSAILGVSSKEEVIDADIICYNGFCSVHQLFSVEDIEFYRSKYPEILIVTHPECPPEVVERSDFVGSTSQIIQYVTSLAPDQKVAVGTEYNLVNRLRKPYNGENHTFVLSSTKPECPTMNETTLEDILKVLQAYKDQNPYNEIQIPQEVGALAKQALDKMMELSK
ncbi:quinolinate synthase NadA [Helicobacter pametensis]|uniref:quinolinate synthase NadA n=1 Tax=Helicobacter pametensis TaxID=95149 RepID=UPI0004828AAD|nr:quinolinate synthase NadA [Helicobacter pametensis]